MKRLIYQIAAELAENGNFNKHFRTAFVVGIILNILNQFEFIFNMKFEDINILKVILTFFVPFMVSVYSAATKNIKE